MSKDTSAPCPIENSPDPQVVLLTASGPPNHWPRLTCLSFQKFVSWALLYYTFSVIQVPMRDELAWDSSLISSGFSLTLLFYALSGPFLGRLFDQCGTWLLMLTGAVGGFSMLFIWSLVEHPIMYLVCMSLMGIFMAACLYEPAFYLVAKWFPARRTAALTFLTFFGALSSPVFLPITERLVEAYDWRIALQILSVSGFFLVVALLISLPRTHTRHPAPEDNDPLHFRQVLRSRLFWRLQVGFVLISITAIGIPVSLIPYLVERGETLRFAAQCTGSIALFGIIGRLAFGRVGDGRGLDFLSALFFALMTVGVFVLLSFSTQAGAYFFAAIFGLGYGALWPSRAALVARAWNGPTLATLAGAFALGPNLAKAGAPLIVTLLATIIGLENTFAIMSLLPLVGAALIWSARGSAQLH